MIAATHHPDLEGLLLADGLDDAIVGVGHRQGQQRVVVYDADLCVQVLMKREGWDHDEALEFLEFNTFGAWVGERTPIWLFRRPSRCHQLFHKLVIREK